MFYLKLVVFLLTFATCSRAAVFKFEQCGNFEGLKTVDLNQFVGDWYMIAATPASGSSVNKCGHFIVKKTSENTFTMKYTTMSHKRNSSVVFNVNGTIGNDVIETWQLQGSEKIIGPMKHVIIDSMYDSYLASLLCGDKSMNLPRERIAMIWSRERSLSSHILGKLKKKLGFYVNKKDIFMVDHTSCQTF